MRVKKVNRYYCDFCKKAGQSSYHMAKHEKHCTMNPSRDCKMCVFANGGLPVPMDELLSVLPAPETANEAIDKGIQGYGVYVLNKLREATDGCPACMLAALRQKGLGGYFNWDFKVECKQVFDVYNREHMSY